MDMAEDYTQRHVETSTEYHSTKNAQQGCCSYADTPACAPWRGGPKRTQQDTGLTCDADGRGRAWRMATHVPRRHGGRALARGSAQAHVEEHAFDGDPSEALPSPSIAASAAAGDDDDDDVYYYNC